MFHHIPVLLQEVVSYLDPVVGGVYVDGTVGGGGHSAAILERIGPTGKMFVFDQDPMALAAAKERLAPYNNQVTFVHQNFEHMPTYLKEHASEGVDGILLDIGVSSPQLDLAERGFSYMHDGPLDMRMNPAASLTAADIVNTYSKEALTKILKDYGEENWADRISELIIEHRPLQSTLQLVDVIERAIPKGARDKNSHVAKRTFQGLRIATNDELGRLDRVIDDAVHALKVGGRLAIITFHSLEDRIVKEKFRHLALRCTCPPELPVCCCNKKQEVRLITRKPIAASKEELLQNSRAKSAKLRVCERMI